MFQRLQLLPVLVISVLREFSPISNDGDDKFITTAPDLISMLGLLLLAR